MNVGKMLAASYNAFVLPRMGAAGREMTAAEAVKLQRGDRAALCRLIENNGGCGEYTVEQADKAFQQIIKSNR